EIHIRCRSDRLSCAGTAGQVVRNRVQAFIVKGQSEAAPDYAFLTTENRSQNSVFQIRVPRKTDVGARIHQVPFVWVAVLNKRRIHISTEDARLEVAYRRPIDPIRRHRRVDWNSSMNRSVKLPP